MQKSRFSHDTAQLRDYFDISASENLVVGVLNLPPPFDSNHHPKQRFYEEPVKVLSIIMHTFVCYSQVVI